MNMATAHALRVLAAANRGEQDELVHAILDRIRASTPEFFGNDDVAADMSAAVRANVARFTQLLAKQSNAATMSLPVETADLLDSTIHHGIPLISLLEAWRTAQTVTIEWWQNKLAAHADAQILPSATKALSHFVSSYVDAGTEQIRASHRRESDRFHNDPDTRRHHLIRQLLAGELIDEIAAAHTLQHPLNARHVAVILWGADETGDTGGFDEALEMLARASAARYTLRMPVTRRRVIAWLSSHGPLQMQALDQVVLPPGVLASASGERAGLDGFVQAHSDATKAAAFARAVPGSGRSRVETFEDTELIILLSNAPEERDRFVLRTLGPLAAPDPRLDILRETLRVYLATGCSQSRTSECLGVHRNTVAYRLRSIDDILPSSKSDNLAVPARFNQQLDLAVALHIIGRLRTR
ncbi:PucR family transcriptional regulator [Parasphingopyxis sp.]|uniref:PucR family transcriptional regulator n=1 Tax=Parasphingopyxis sp. TaxID=1920299 RepID=UPI003F9FE638